jgi:ribosome-associated toxin RatA of RatAB toxin-antitoxin module
MANEVLVNAPPARIFALAGATERWPKILPHYRFVRVLEERGASRVVEMAARRGFIPVRWRAEQTNDAATPCIDFRHLSGWTKGMSVRWTFTPEGAGTRVRIEHELRSPIAQIAGKYFIDPIATRTLNCMKAEAEKPG